MDFEGVATENIPLKRRRRNRTGEETADFAPANALQRLFDRLFWRLRNEGDAAKIEMNQQIQALAREHPSIFAERYSTPLSPGLLPLVAAIIFHHVTTLETIRAVYSAYPDAISISEGGSLPIHHACMYNLPVDVVRFLHQMHPESFMMKDNSGDTPLHLACDSWNGADATLQRQRDVTRYILQACPGCALEVDKYGSTPLQRLLFRTPLRASELRLAVDIARVVPSCASIPNTYAQVLPLQRALEMLSSTRSHPSVSAIDSLKQLVEVYPKAIAELDGNFVGWANLSLDVRLLLFAFNLSQSLGFPFEYAKEFPLHATLLQKFRRFRQALIDEAIVVYRDQLNRWDNQCGLLPLHLALLRLASSTNSDDDAPMAISITTVEKMLDFEPRAALVCATGRNCGVYPFMIAATVRLDEENNNGNPTRFEGLTHRRVLNLIYALLRMDAHRLISGAIE